MQVVSLASGSKGNACLVQTAVGALLVDAGIPQKTLLTRCARFGTRPEHIIGIIITHEHGDHTTCAVALAKRYGIPIYTMADTAQKINIPATVVVKHLDYQHPTNIAGITIRTMAVSHDAVAPIAVQICFDRITAAIATDLGEWQTLLVPFLQAAQLIVIEANHDRERLRLSSYEPTLKLRIASATGHLDNIQTATLLAQVAQDKQPRDVWLAHLSREANSPAIAIRSIHTVLDMHACQQYFRSITPLPPHDCVAWGPAQRTTQQTLW
ncbi:MAG: MBL fold metallo-hydrolase [Chloroflexia bacterium]|nr:MBL fold metallo-hydrolase [Chloroflexia bacterium]